LGGQKFFNKKQLYFKLKIKDFIKSNFFGVNIFHTKKFEERLEISNCRELITYKNNK
jgi:hypothetical protein